MTVTSSKNPPGVHEIVVRDEFGPLKFVGKVVAELAWTYEEAKERNFQRWTDVTLYRVHAGSVAYRYVIQIVGRSVFYHDPKGPCHRGISMAVGTLYEDDDRYQALEACPRCSPTELDEMKMTALVSAEENLYSLYRCPNAAAAVRDLYSRGTKVQGKVTSSLSLKVLQAASLVDKDIEAAMLKLRQL